MSVFNQVPAIDFDNLPGEPTVVHTEEGVTYDAQDPSEVYIKKD